MPNIKVTLIFDPGRTTDQCDLNELNDQIIQLLINGFPEHSGTFMSLFHVDDNGDPVRK